MVHRCGTTGEGRPLHNAAVDAPNGCGGDGRAMVEGGGEGTEGVEGAEGMPTSRELRAARRALAAVAARTPLLECEPLSRDADAHVWLKLENLQRTGSYKIRGAFTKISRLRPAVRARGVITASAGNHAQGVAFAARRVRVPATVVMPVSAPVYKVASARELGANVVLHGDTYEQAEAEARRLEAARGYTFVHPFDDWDVIAGQASVTLEILEDFPAGAGGPRRPRLIGVQARGADAAVRSFAARQPVAVPAARTIADGIRVTRPGARPLQAILSRVDEMAAVGDEEIARAVVYLLERAKLLVEPAGAAGVAALLARAITCRSEDRVCVVLTGGNVDVNLVARIIEHGLTRAGRYLVVRARLDDRPGQLAALLQPLSAMRVNIIDIEHHRAGWLLPVGQSDVVLHLEARDLHHARDIVAALQRAGYAAEPLTPLEELV